MPPGALPGSEVLAVTEITGEWNGTVCLACSRAAARHATAVMFGIDDEDLTPADVTDAVGELINVVGGNIKSLVPGRPCFRSRLCTKTVKTRLPSHLELAQEVRFSWMAEPVVVSVWTENSN